MKQTVKSKRAPITGLGMIANDAASLGTKAKTIRIAPQANPIRRLVAPVAMDRPTLALEVDCPIVPTPPDNITPQASARMPLLIDFISARFHSASLIFWQVVKSPTALSDEANAVTRKGTSNAPLNDQDSAGKDGRARREARSKRRKCSSVTRPLA